MYSIATYNNFSRIAKILITYGADHTIKDKQGYTPLGYAETYDHIRIIEMLEN